MKCLILLLPLITKAKANNDYWADDFDEDKNCVREEEMKELQRDVDQGKCASSSAGNEYRNDVFYLISIPQGQL